ncbi:MAG: gamma-glutamylcyclotransferase family protein [Candidatus Promineifilaceae bacterium]|nr:gamma-glutamylcyclotransferase family protein [Candidatus Promineifilaceae bacterium]
MTDPEHQSDSRPYPFFVYGTLLPGQPNHALWGRSIGASQTATFRGGRLYDMGHYPMLVEAQRGLVKGLAISVRPNRYRRLLRRLDRLERYDPQQPEHPLYRRVLRPVARPDGESLTAWVYLGRPELVAGRPLIPAGDWVAYAARRYPDLPEWWAGRDQP